MNSFKVASIVLVGLATTSLAVNMRFFGETPSSANVKIGNQPARALSSGEILTLKVGQELTLMFDFASGTGFDWHLTSDKLPGLTLKGSEDMPKQRFVTDPGRGLGGGDKVRKFNFVVSQKMAQQNTMTFEKKRGEKEVAQTLYVPYTISD